SGPSRQMPMHGLWTGAGVMDGFKSASSTSEWSGGAARMRGGRPTADCPPETRTPRMNAASAPSPIGAGSGHVDDLDFPDEHLVAGCGLRRQVDHPVVALLHLLHHFRQQARAEDAGKLGDLRLDRLAHERAADLAAAGQRDADVEGD